MSICAICGKDKDNVCTVCVGNNKTEERCKECNWKIIKKEQEEYQKQYKEKVLPYFKENNYIIKIDEYSNEGRKVSLFKFQEHPSEVVDFIRKQMKQPHVEEDWIDVHEANINGVDIEICDYLHFTKYEGNTVKEIDDIDYCFELIKGFK